MITYYCYAIWYKGISSGSVTLVASPIHVKFYLQTCTVGERGDMFSGQDY
jgi:hypothetical protein